MTQIFISYRSDDTEEVAGRLYDALKARFGRERVFRDIYTIRAGEEFAKAIDRVIGESDVVLALIGRKWLTSTDSAGRRRLDDPADLLRREIGTALSHGKWVIPVRVQGATMPDESELPNELVGLARRNAVELTDARWDYDVEQLVRALRAGSATASPRRPFARLWLPAAGLLLLASMGAALVVGLRVIGPSPPAPGTQPVPTQAATLATAVVATMLVPRTHTPTPANTGTPTPNATSGPLRETVVPIATSVSTGDDVLSAVKVFQIVELGLDIAFIPESFRMAGLSPGAVIWMVKSGLAQTAGLHAGDVVTSINGQEIATEDDLRRAIRAIGPGKSRYLIQRDGEPLTIEIDCPTCKVT
jgi:TIR domain/PDZ domain